MTVLVLCSAGGVLSLLPWRWVLAAFGVLAAAWLSVHLFGPANVWVPLILVASPFVVAGWLATLSLRALVIRMRTA